MEKMLDFKSFSESMLLRGGADGETYWNAARQGMIPESEAIRIWPVEKWPIWAKEIRLSFIDETDESVFTIETIPRPRPQWEPKSGDLIVGWANGTTDDCTLDQAWRHRAGDEIIHVALVETLDDIGRDIAWFKANRKWI